MNGSAGTPVAAAAPPPALSEHAVLRLLNKQYNITYFLQLVNPPSPVVTATSDKGLEGQRPRCPFTPRAQGRRGRRPSMRISIAIAIAIPIPKNGGATASFPFYPEHKAAAAGGPPCRFDFDFDFDADRDTDTDTDTDECRLAVPYALK